VAKAPWARAITAPLSNVDVTVLLRPGKPHDRGIIKSPKKLAEPQDASSRRVCFLIYWRKTSSTWLPQVPVVIMTSTGDIERIAAAAPKQDWLPSHIGMIHATSSPAALLLLRPPLHTSPSADLSC